MQDIKYASFGNTTLRVANLANNIEKQLLIFNDLFKHYPDFEWIDSETSLQFKYFEKLIDEKLVQSNEKNYQKKTKVARQKSVPLEDFGLINRSKKTISSKGQMLLDLLNDNESSQLNGRNNFLQIENISLFYLSAFFDYKKNDGVEGNFPKYLSVFNAFNFELSQEIFECLPLINNFDLNEFISLLKQLSNQQISQKDLIVRALIKSGIESQLSLFKLDIVKNKKIVDTSYFKGAKGGKWVPKIQHFLSFCEDVNNQKHTLENFESIYEDKYIKEKFIKPAVKHIPFRSNNLEDIYSAFTDYVMSNFVGDFYREFFLYIKVVGIIQNLKDYYDLNKRYLGLTDCFEFGDIVSINENLRVLFEVPDQDFVSKTLRNILSFEEDSLDHLLDNEFINRKLISLGVASTFDLKERKSNSDKEKIQTLLDKKFTRNELIRLIRLFSQRSVENDKELQKSVSLSATVPTIFEYLIALAWCYFDNTLDPILSANLSLDTDMLPKSHAGGGQSDIPIDKIDHKVMLEVTLTNNVNQRRAETESVTRHLGKLLESIDNPEIRDKSYGVFIAPELHHTVLDDFRFNKNREWRNQNREIVAHGLNILSLNTEQIIAILTKDLNYSDLLPNFRRAMNSDNMDGVEWQETEVATLFVN